MTVQPAPLWTGNASVRGAGFAVVRAIAYVVWLAPLPDLNALQAFSTCTHSAYYN